MATSSVSDFETYPADVDIKVIHLGREPRISRMIFQEMPGPNHRDVKVREEKERLLSMERIQIPPPDQQIMVIVYTGDGGKSQTIEMEDDELMLSYRNYLCRDAHVEFRRV